MASLSIRLCHDVSVSVRAEAFVSPAEGVWVEGVARHWIGHAPHMVCCLATGTALLIQEAFQPMRLRCTTTVYVREPPPVIGNSKITGWWDTLYHWAIGENESVVVAASVAATANVAASASVDVGHLSAARTIFVGSKRKPNSRQAFPSANSHIQELKPKRHSSGPAAIAGKQKQH